MGNEIQHLKDSIYQIVKSIQSLSDRIGEIESSQRDAISDIRKGVDQLLISGQFYDKFTKHIMKIIADEIRVSIRNNDIMNDLRGVTKTTIQNNIQELIRVVVKETVSQQLKKYTYEATRVKELAHSIDTTIKHTLAQHPVSIEFESIVMEKVSLDLQKMSDGYLLERKNGG